MKKNTFYSLIFLAMLTGCAVIESSETYSSEAIRRAELGALIETSQEEPKTDDIITLNSDSISVAEAIIKDNE